MAGGGAITPKTALVRTLCEVGAALEVAGCPAVVKIAQPWLLPPGARASFLAHGAQEVADYLVAIRREAEPDVIVQEYVPGEHAEDWFYHGYHGQGGEPVVGLTGRKFRSHPPHFGATSYAISLVNNEVLEISKRILRSLRYAGVVELEYRLDRRDGRYKLFDFNPRPGAQFQFLRTSRGVDVVRALHLDLTGRRPSPDAQAENCAFVSEFADTAAFTAYWRTGKLDPLSWLAQFVRAEERAWFALDDPRPFLSAGARTAGRGLRRMVNGRTEGGRA